MRCPQVIPQFDPKHVINLKHGVYDCTTYDDLDKIFDELKWSGKHKLVIHFHGGNVSSDAGMEQAQCMYTDYNKAAYPLFFVWESSPLEISPGELGDALARYAAPRLNEPIFKLARDAVLRVAIGVSRARGDERDLSPVGEEGYLAELRALDEGREPFRDEPSAEIAGVPLTEALRQRARVLVANLLSDSRQWRHQMQRLTAELFSPSELRRALAVSRQVPIRISRWSLLTPRSLQEPYEQFKAWLSVPVDRARISESNPTEAFINEMLTLAVGTALGRVLDRFERKRDHGWYCTVVEETLRELFQGGIAWVYGKILEGASDAFQPDPATYGGTGFLEKLNNYLRHEDSNLSVLLVGYSGGAAYVCDMLQAATSLPDWFAFDVVFLAPAATYEQVRQTLTVAEPRILGFRMFALTDERERGHNVCGAPNALCDLYPRSLLYFVSGICETDVADEMLVGMQRFGEDRRDYTPAESLTRAVVIDFIARRGGAVWAPTAPTAPPGRRCGATIHEGMSDDPETRESLISILEHGF